MERPDVEYVKAENGLNLRAVGDYNSDESSHDSDVKQLFQLPKRKILRSPSAALMKKVGAPSRGTTMLKKCCRVCLATVLPLAIALFVVAVVLALGFVMIVLSGMKDDINVLKLRLENVESADRGSRIKNQEMVFEIRKQMVGMKQELASVNDLSERLANLNNQVQLLNKTLQDVKREVDSSKTGRILSLVRDMESLKSGMADTGSEIEKLKSTNRILTDDVASMKTDLRDASDKLFNVTVTVSQLAQLPAPVRVATPTPVVVTLTPNEDRQPYTKKEVDRLLDELRNVHRVELDASAAKMTMELYKLGNSSEMLNQTHSDIMLHVSSQLRDVLRRTSLLERSRLALSAQVDAWVNESTSELRRHERFLMKLERQHDPTSADKIPVRTDAPSVPASSSSSASLHERTLPVNLSSLPLPPTAGLSKTSTVRDETILAHDEVTTGAPSEVAEIASAIASAVHSTSTDQPEAGGSTRAVRATDGLAVVSPLPAGIVSAEVSSLAPVDETVSAVIRGGTSDMRVGHDVTLRRNHPSPLDLQSSRGVFSSADEPSDDPNAEGNLYDRGRSEDQDDESEDALNANRDRFDDRSLDSRDQALASLDRDPAVGHA